MATNELRLWLTSAVFAMCCISPNVLADEYLYRYENEKGVKVLNHTIPPEYAQKGYEVLSLKGQLIKVVPPALSDDEVAKVKAERQLREKYVVLKRRYSTLDDIESAKLRRLQNINTNISILRGNIGSINIRIENLMNKAAEMERSGRTVSAQFLHQLKDARAELMVAERSLDKRLEEYESVSKRFDQDVATFIEGSKLADIDNQLN